MVDRYCSFMSSDEEETLLSEFFSRLFRVFVSD